MLAFESDQCIARAVAFCSFFEEYAVGHIMGPEGSYRTSCLALLSRRISTLLFARTKTRAAGDVFSGRAAQLWLTSPGDIVRIQLFLSTGRIFCTSEHPARDVSCSVFTPIAFDNSSFRMQQMQRFQGRLYLQHCQRSCQSLKAETSAASGGMTCGNLWFSARATANNTMSHSIDQDVSSSYRKASWCLELGSIWKPWRGRKEKEKETMKRLWRADELGSDA